MDATVTPRVSPSKKQNTIKVKVVKKSGRVEEWNPQKIKEAASASAQRAERVLTDRQLNELIGIIAEQVLESGASEIAVNELHIMVEKGLDHIDPEVATQYRSYRNYKQSFANMMHEVIRQSDYFRNHIYHENANADAQLVSTKRTLIYKSLSWQLYKTFFLSENEKIAHEEGYIYIHDRSDRSDTMNCCLLDVGRVLHGGFELENMHYNEPTNISSAIGVMTDIMMAAGGNQYGGLTVPEIDSVLEPYCEKSYKKYLAEYARLAASFNAAPDAEKADAFACEKIQKDLADGFQGMEYKLNTLSSSRGDFIFTTLTFGLDERRFGRMISEAILKVRLQGQGEKGNRIPAIFPKLVFLFDEEKHGDNKPLNGLFKKAIECSAAAQYPDYLNLRSTGDNELGVPYGSPAYMYQHFYNGVYRWHLGANNTVEEDEKWVDCIISPMGCRAYLSPYFYNRKTGEGSFHEIKDNPDFKPVYTGRWNGGPVSLNLPMIFMKAKTEKKDFYEVLDHYLSIIKNIHIKTKNYLSKLKASSNPLAYTQGGFFNGTLNPHDEIAPLLDSVTFSFGFTALNELQELYDGHYLGDSHQFAYEVEKHIIDYYTQYKEPDRCLYTIYATPAESLAYTQREQFVKKYGMVDVGPLVDPVGTHEYWTNSFHDPVWVDIPLENFDRKFKDEKEGFDLAAGGHIVYYRIPTSNNLQLIEKIVKTALRYNFYYGVNIAKSFCQNCHFKWDDDKFDLCPKCNSAELVSISRVCGYLGYTRIPGRGEAGTRMAGGKLAEIHERKVM